VSHYLYLVVPDPQFLTNWAGAIAVPFAYILYVLPWRNWGWALKPWQKSASVLPGIILLLTCWTATIPCLLIVAGFYAWLAKAREQLRLSYLSLLLGDWAIIRWLFELEVNEPFWYTVVLGGSLLYITQIDPGLRSPTDREKRHLLRAAAVGLICLAAIYESETGVWMAIATLGLSITLVLAGLSLRMWAFLYIGTATFIFQILRQPWLLVNTYSLLIWAVGIVQRDLNLYLPVHKLQFLRLYV
jgi:hypothetical protein